MTDEAFPWVTLAAAWTIGATLTAGWVIVAAWRIGRSVHARGVAGWPW